jgi:hypothetical protein
MLPARHCCSDGLVARPRGEDCPGRAARLGEALSMRDFFDGSSRTVFQSRLPLAVAALTPCRREGPLMEIALSGRGSSSASGFRQGSPLFGLVSFPSAADSSSSIWPEPAPNTRRHVPRSCHFFPELIGPHTNLLFPRNVVHCSLSSGLLTNSYALCRRPTVSTAECGRADARAERPRPANASKRVAFACSSSAAGLRVLESTTPDGPGIVRFEDASFSLDRFDIGGLLAFWTNFHVEADLLILLQGLETCCADFREVGKQVVPAVVRRDESKPVMSRATQAGASA